MSVHVTSPIWKSGVKGLAKLVLLKLGDCADDDGGNAFPSVATIARECGMAERSVQRILTGFVKEGVLVIEDNAKGGRRRSRVYRIDLERVTVCHPLSDGKGDSDDTLSRGKGDCVSPFNGRKGDSDDIKGDSDDVKGCRQSHPNLKEPSLEPFAQAGARDPGAAPACAVWRDRQGALAERFGERWAVYGPMMIPEEDRDGVLVLATSTRFYKDLLSRELAPGIGEVLDRDVEIVERSWAKRAIARLEAERRRAGEMGLG